MTAAALHRIVPLVLATLCFGLAAPAGADAPPPPEISCSSAVLIDPETGQILLERDADQRRFMASLTKMMTALLVAESGDLRRTVTVGSGPAKIGETTMNLTAGEEISLEHLLMGVLLSSANDAAAACAEAVSGSVEAFVQRMNERARELGMTNTQFQNPHGLHEEGHYSTAHDLALLAVAVTDRPELRAIIATQEATVPWPGRSYDRTLRNRNRLLSEWSDADGIKTGYTRQAGNCLAASANVDGWRLIAIVLGCEEEAWVEARKPLEWRYESFLKVALVSTDLTEATVEVRGGVRESVHARAAEDVIAVVPRAELREPELVEGVARAPIAAGDVVGSLAVLMPDGTRRQVNLVATEEVRGSLWALVTGDRRYLLALAAIVALAVGVLVHGATSEALGPRGAG